MLNHQKNAIHQTPKDLWTSSPRGRWFAKVRTSQVCFGTHAYCSCAWKHASTVRMAQTMSMMTRLDPLEARINSEDGADNVNDDTDLCSGTLPEPAHLRCAAAPRSGGSLAHMCSFLKTPQPLDPKQHDL